MSRPLVSRVILVLVGLALYANALGGPFIYDDTSSLLENEHVHHVWPPDGLVAAQPETSLTGRPVVALTFALGWVLHGPGVWGHHAVNVALHLACALVLFALVRRTLAGLPAFATAPLPDRLALAVTLLWLVHPLNTEAVNYLTQRTELLMGFFYLSTLYAALRARTPGRHRRAWTFGAVVACALGMASKEVMVTAPLMVVLYDLAYPPPDPRPWRARLRERLPLYAGLASTWILLAFLMWYMPRSSSVGTHLEISAWTYLLNQCAVVARYLRLVVWPVGLVIDYGEPRVLTAADVWPQGVVVLLLVLTALVLMVRRPALGFPALWVFLVLAPTSTVVPITTEAGAERRMYLPLVGAVTVLVMGVHALLARASGPLPARQDAPIA